MKIEWNKVTSFSQIFAVVLFLVVFFVGFFVGRPFGARMVTGDPLIIAKYICEGNQKVRVDYYENFVYIKFEGIKTYLQRTISASGVRFANGDESLVFWGKGDGAFIELDGVIYIDNCVVEKGTKEEENLQAQESDLQ
jgi:hypothetical protein